MENSSYALYIAVGVLVAIMILTILLFAWKKFGLVQKSQDDSVEVKNRAEFNAEYEAYNKKLMYGSDVLSCLNKAQNNNQKYVYNNYYGTDLATIGKDGRAEFFIDVEVTINSPLHDEIRAYYKDDKGKFQRAIGSRINSTNYSDKVFGTGTGNRFSSPIVYYYYFKQGKVYQETKNYIEIMWPSGSKDKTLYQILNSKGIIETNFKDGTYNLLTLNNDNTSVEDKKNTAKLSALLSTVNLKSEDLENVKVKNNTIGDSDWWYCTWITSSNDFKTRKFICDGVEYNENTGYIQKIKFKEK